MILIKADISNLFNFLLANGDGSRQPSQKELEIAATQGENFGKVVSTYYKGKSTI